MKINKNNYITYQNKIVFGPLIWNIIHTIAANLCYDRIKDYNRFILYISEFLPCEDCKYHFKELIKIYPLSNYIPSSNNFVINNDLKESALLWTYMIHNDVNKRINRKSPSFLLVKKYYDKRIINYEDLWSMIHLFSFYTDNYVKFIDFILLINRLCYFYDDKLIEILKNYPISSFHGNGNDSILLWTFVIKDELSRCFSYQSNNNKIKRSSGTSLDIIDSKERDDILLHSNYHLLKENFDNNCTSCSIDI